MATLFNIPSQRNRRISFSVSGGGGASANVDMTIRPEELTVIRPGRVTVQQTLAGAWVDAYDEGVATIRLSGHTGWRGAPGGQNGEAAFQSLRTGAFKTWNDARSAQAAAGADPGAVEMVFVDELDGFVALVAPKVFTLRRSKTRPLLSMYVIELLVLDWLAEDAYGDQTSTNAAALIGGFIDPIQNQIAGAISTFNAGTQLAIDAGALLGFNGE